MARLALVHALCISLALPLALGCGQTKEAEADDQSEAPATKPKKKDAKPTKDEAAKSKEDAALESDASLKDGFGGILGADAAAIYDGFGPSGLLMAAPHDSTEPATFSAGWIARESSVILQRAIAKELPNASAMANGTRCGAFLENNVVRRLITFHDEGNYEYAMNNQGRVILWLRAKKNDNKDRDLAYFHRDNLMRYEYWSELDRNNRMTTMAPQGLREFIFAEANACYAALGAANPTAGTFAVPAQPAAAPVAPVAPISPEGTFESVLQLETPYEIVMKHSGLCLEVPSSSNDNGKAIVQAACTGAANQRFTLHRRGDHVFIKAQHSGSCLDVRGAEMGDSATVQQWSCVDVANQTWGLQSKGDTAYRLFAKHSGRCLDVPGSSKDSGKEIAQFNCGDSDNQRLQFRKAR